MNKADYTSLINTKLPSGSLIPATDHRDTMHTDPNSIIELVYNDAVSDDEVSETYTSSTGLFDYDIKLYKVGGEVVINGRFDANSGLLATSSVLQITNTDYTPLASTRFNGYAHQLGGEVIPIYVLDNHLRVGASVLNGETYYFTINFKSAN